MGNKKVRAHGLQVLLMSPQLPRSVFNTHLLFDQTAQLDRAKVNLPDAVVNLFQADVLAGAADTDVHPVAVPPDAAVVADVARLIVRWVLQCRQLLRVGSRTRLVD